jgi:surface carbohydrate biosynthesis protein
LDQKRVVILVDNKKRDLPGAALIAYHLEKLGIKCFLEPLEAWKACLAARKPHMIIFNHLLGSHLVKYSQELHKMGVLVGVLPNEGILYNKEVLEFNASKFHNNAHIDYFFVWNEAHKEAIMKNNPNNIKNVEIIGVPRFDFYFEPLRVKRNTLYPTILVCTNFVFAQFMEKDPKIADKLFAPWKGRISSYSDYWNLIKVNYKSRKLFFEFLNKLISLDKYNIILKPHPGEEIDVYRKWYDSLEVAQKQKITLDTTSYIWELIPQCDVEIACETCTTTLESWIAGKPTIELILTKHPVFFHEFLAKMSYVCDDPILLDKVIQKALKREYEKEFKKLRKEHLKKWCANPRGNSSKKLALIIKKAVENTNPNFEKLDFSYKRKAKKLLLLEKLNLPYNYNPFSIIKAILFPNKYKDKLRIYNKTIKPSDVKKWKNKIKEMMDKYEKTNLSSS